MIYDAPDLVHNKVKDMVKVEADIMSRREKSAVKSSASSA